MKNDLLILIGFLFLLLACQSDYLLNIEFDDQSLFQLPFATVSAQPMPAADSATKLNVNVQDTIDSQSSNIQAGKAMQMVKLLSIGLIGLFWSIRKENLTNTGVKGLQGLNRILRLSSFK